MKISIDESRYEDLMAGYQVSEIARLNEVLKRHGIHDQHLRKAICGDFAAANGSFLDKGWIEGEGGERHWPELLFSRRELHPDEGLGGMDELVVPPYASDFGGYASGNLTCYFEEHHESLGEVVAGQL